MSEETLNANSITINGVTRYIEDSVARLRANEALNYTSPDLLDNVKFSWQQINTKYEGRSLAELFADEIEEYDGDEAAWFKNRIINGIYTDMRIGDYFDINLSDGKVFRYRIAAIDPYLHCGDQEITEHHAMMVPDTVWPDSVVWNTTNNNNGTASEKHPYLASNLHKWELETFLPLLPQKWKNVIANHRMLLEERYSATADLTESTAWSWVDMGKIWSLSETEVYGFCVRGTKVYSVGMDCHFTLFPDTASRIRRNPDGERYHWWLRGVGSGYSTSACHVGSSGNATNTTTTDAFVRPLPCFRV